MEGQPELPGDFALNLGARTAVCLGRLCHAEIGERCGLRGVTLEIDPTDQTAMSVERICDVEDVDCPGTFLIEQAANQAITQLTSGQN